MAIGGVVINFRANADRARHDIDKLSRSVGGVGDSAKKAGTSIKGIFTGALKAGVAGVGIAAVGTGIALVDAAKAAYSDAQAAGRLVRTLDKIPGVSTKAAEATGTWIDSMELATGIADDDLRQALGRLAVAVGDVTKAQGLLKIAADASVGSGKEFATVSEAMTKAAGGNTNALKRLFPQLDAGPDKVLTLKEAVDQLGKSYGGAAKAAEDNDVFGRIGTIAGQLKEAIGGIALPMLENLAGWFADKDNRKKVQGWINKVGEWATAVGTDFAGKVKDFVAYLQSDEGKKAISDFSSDLRGIASAFDSIATAIGGVVGAWDRLPDFLKGNPLSQFGNWLNDHPPPWQKTPRKKEYGDDPDEWFPPQYPDRPPQTDGAKPVRSKSKGKSSVSQTFIINNPKPEKASTSIAAAQRAARYLSV